MSHHFSPILLHTSISSYSKSSTRAQTHTHTHTHRYVDTAPQISMAIPVLTRGVPKEDSSLSAVRSRAQSEDESMIMTTKEENISDEDDDEDEFHQYHRFRGMNPDSNRFALLQCILKLQLRSIKVAQVQYAHQVNKMTHALVSLIDMLVDFGFYVNTYELEVVASHVAKIMDPSTDVTFQSSQNRHILNPDCVDINNKVNNGSKNKIVPINDDVKISSATPNAEYQSRRDRHFTLANEESSSVVRLSMFSSSFSLYPFKYKPTPTHTGTHESTTWSYFRLQNIRCTARYCNTRIHPRSLL